MDGSDYIGYHRDKIKDFQHGTSVLTVSLGATRVIQLKNDKTKEVVEISLEPGSLFILGWKTNKEWKHCIPKRAPSIVKDARISLTYRSIASMHYPAELKEEENDDEEEDS